LDGKTQGVFASLVVPPPSAPGAQKRFAAVQEYVQLLKEYAPEAEPDSVGLEGFINAKVLVEALQRAGRELDRPAFIKAVQSIRSMDIGIGTPLSYSIVDHQGLDHVFMTRFVDGHPAIITDWDRLREQLRRTESTQ
jgi:ABC-type branched-subunit amino acid transport system substrate-binding protein